MIRRALGVIAMALAAVLVTAASAPRTNWNATVTQGPNGAFTLGNPAAKVKLTEYESYTCPHCANFQRQSEALLRLTYVQQGKVSITVQQILRNPVDLTVAMLTACGEPRQFFVRHNAFFATQDQWLGKMSGFSKAQTDRWLAGPVPDRLRAIASDFDFYETMSHWGFSHTDVDRCLADPAALKRVTAQTEQASDLGVDSTPSFALDGVVLAGTHEWSSLAPQIDARL